MTVRGEGLEEVRGVVGEKEREMEGMKVTVE